MTWKSNKTQQSVPSTYLGGTRRPTATDNDHATVRRLNPYSILHHHYSIITHNNSLPPSLCVTYRYRYRPVHTLRTVDESNHSLTLTMGQSASQESASTAHETGFGATLSPELQGTFASRHYRLLTHLLTHILTHTLNH